MRQRFLFPTVALAVTVMIAVSCSDRTDAAGPTGSPSAITLPPSVPPGPPGGVGKPTVGITFVAGGGDMPAGSTASYGVRVADKKGNPLAGRLVQWSSTNGGSLNPLFGQTDAAGYVATEFTAANVAGTQHVITATTSELTASASATVVAAEAFSILKHAGDGGRDKVGAVRSVSALIRDAYGNPVPGYDVQFKIVVGAGSLTPAIATTNGQGIATSQWTLGPVADYQLVEAGAANGSGLQGSPATFQVEAEPGPPATIQINPSSAEISGYEDETYAFTATAYDAYGNVIDPSKVVVTWNSSHPALVLITDSGYAAVMTNICSDTTVTITATAGNASGQASLTLLHVPCE